MPSSRYNNRKRRVALSSSSSSSLSSPRPSKKRGGALIVFYNDEKDEYEYEYDNNNDNDCDDDESDGRHCKAAAYDYKDWYDIEDFATDTEEEEEEAEAKVEETLFGDEEDEEEQEQKQKQEAFLTEEEQKKRLFVRSLKVCGCCLIVFAILALWFHQQKTGGAGPSKNIRFLPLSANSLVVWDAVEDTYLRGGSYRRKVFGRHYELAVQNTEDVQNYISYALLKFDVSPPTNDNDDGNDGDDGRTTGWPSHLDSDTFVRKVTLKLHLANRTSTSYNQNEEQLPRNITIVRLPPTESNIETWSWHKSPIHTNTPDRIDGPTIQVIPSKDEVLEIDISSLFSSPSPSSSTSSSTDLIRKDGEPPRAREGVDDNDSPEQVLLMVESVVSQSLDPIVFQSREFQNGTKTAQLIHAFVTAAPTMAPTSSVQPSSAPTTETPTTSMQPSSEPSVQPTQSSQPSQKPTISHVPTSSASPSNQPTRSLAPSAFPTGPTVSPAPSTEMPSAVPTRSLTPTLSFEPTSLLEYCSKWYTPPMYDIAGSQTPYPAGALEYVSQESAWVTVRVHQQFSNATVDWITLYHCQGKGAKEECFCSKERNVTANATILRDVNCFQKEKHFAIIVNDPTVPAGPDLRLPRGCVVDDDDLKQRKVAYLFQLRCDPPPPECKELNVIEV